MMIPNYDFPTDLDAIKNRVDAINPKNYTKTRNFIHGAVTYLSPYISRGVISTKHVAESVLQKGVKPYEIEKFLQELAWRDYWQQIWIEKGEEINIDLRNQQQPVSNHGIPASIMQQTTGVEMIDQAIESLIHTGYMHNHIRMYVAAITCNMAYSHWHLPAKWMYYHLLDGDWASNALSWQWVSGANANKKYVANQTNINKYTGNTQRNTFLDVDYERFQDWSVPQELETTITPTFETTLPDTESITIDGSKPTYIYNWYNLDPHWTRDVDCNRILLLEPSIFEQYPISKQSMSFMLDLSKNIDSIQLFVGEFNDLHELAGEEIHYKEHPLNFNYIGTEHPREWISSVTGYYRSFFGFWKKLKKEKNW